MSKRLSTPKNLARWASKRAGNLDRMLKEAKTDDSRLFSYSSTMLDALASLMTSIGDDAGSLYVASLARLIDGRVGHLEGKVRRLKELLHEAIVLGEEANGDPSSCSYIVPVGERLKELRKESK